MFRLNFTPGSMETHARRISMPLPKFEDAHLVFTANIDHVRELATNHSFKDAYSAATVVTADGVPVYLHAVATGQTGVEHVAGSDLLVEICKLVSPLRCKLAFICSSEATAVGVRTRLSATGFADADILTLVPAFGFELDHHRSDDMLQSIAEFGPTHLFMGVGAPKSEVWLHTHRNRLGGVWCCGFGAGIDYFAGTKMRAPRLFRVARLEWFWRAMIEPRRLVPRYVAGAVFLLRSIYRDVLDRTKDASAPSA